jgi:hypothetical protein
MTEEIATSAARAGGDETSSKPTAKEPVGEYELARRWLHQRGRHGIIEDYERREVVVVVVVVVLPSFFL